MKKFSIRLLMLAALVSIACSAYTPKTTHHLTAPVANAVVKAASAKAAQCFYWFMEPADYLDVYGDLSYEISQLGMAYGGLITTDPAGGIWIASGYAWPNQPHMMNAQIMLYLHI
jgi:hypothetical protein